MLLSENAVNLTEGIENLQKVDKNVVQQYLEDLVPGLLNFAVELVLAVVFYLVGRRAIAFIRKILRKSMERREVDVGVRQFFDSLAKYFLYFLLWLMILTLFGITAASVVAVLGSAGLTLGLALQGSLANFAGGVLILLIKPFRVGDYIVVRATGSEGTVSEISTFYTKLQTIDNQTVMVPNGKLTDDAVVNVTAQKKRRIDLTVGISYDADLRLAKSLLHELVGAEPRALLNEQKDVYVSALADSSVELGCRFWVKTEDYWQTRWDMLEQIKLTFDAHSIEIPYQKVDVNICYGSSVHELHRT